MGSSSLLQLLSLVRLKENGDMGLLKMGSKSLRKPEYTKWYESSLIKCYSSQSNLFLQTLQLQQTLFSSFQCDNNGAWHWPSLPNTARWAGFRTGENKVALVQCYAPKTQPAETAVCASHTVTWSRCSGDHIKYQTLLSRSQTPGFTIPHRVDLRAFVQHCIATIDVHWNTACL